MTNSRLYSSLLVALFAICAVILLTAVPSLYLVARRAERTRRSIIADACASDLQQVAAADDATFEATARALEQKYGVVRISTSGATSRASQVRRVGMRTINIDFGSDPLDEPRRLLSVAAVTAAAAVVAGLALLLLNLKSDRPRAEPDYLFQTFQTSIRSLKDMRNQEKERADELQTVTRTLVRSMTSGFISIDPQGRVVDMNEQAREMLGLSADHPAAGVSIREALGDNRFSKTLQDAIDSRAPLQREEIALADDGPLFGLTTVPLRDEQSRFFGMLALFVDLSPMRRLEARVRALQSLADVGEMSAGIAHEFRNSLSTIMGYLRLARRDALPRDSDERLARAEAEADLLNSAVTSLLSFARPVALQLQPLDAMELVRSVADQQLATRNAIEIRCDGPAVLLDADAALLRRAFENVIRNAVEAVDARHPDGGGRIDVASSRTSEGSRITIRDNGVGLNAADAARLFLPFQSMKPNGFGLGLALAKKIILLHGGSIQLEGEPGVGATVTIDFAGATVNG